MNLHVRRIDKARDFMALEPLWSQLARESGQTSPFLSYDWFWCCWHGVWPQRRPEVLLMDDAGGLVAIIPLMHWRERFRGLPVRCLGFLESPCTPLVDILTVGQRDRVIEAFLDHLAGRSDWDTVWLQKLPVDSPTLKALDEILPGRLPWRRAGNLFSPYVAITGEWDSFYGSKNHSGKGDQPDLQDQFGHASEVSLEVHRNVDPQSPLFHEAIEVMRHSLEKPGRKGAIATMPRTVEFFCELTRRATKNDWLSLWLLRLNGHAVAMEYQLQTHGSVQVLRSDEAPWHRELLPGISLKLAILRSLFESGCVYEYVSTPDIGDDLPWWADGGYKTVCLKLYRPGLYSRLRARLERVPVSEARK